MVDIRQVGVDRPSLSEGRWLDLVEDFGIKVRSIRSPEFQAKLLEHRGEDGTLPEDAYDKVCAESLPSDWRGLTEDGEPLPFDAERCAEMLLSDGWRTYLEDVQIFATRLANYREKQAEAAEKNS